MPFISLFDIISIILLSCEAEGKGRSDPKFFLCIPTSAADAVAVNPKRIKMLLANGLITFFINGSPVFSNGPSSLPRVFHNLISVDDLSANVLRRFETCLLVNNSSCGKFILS